MRKKVPKGRKIAEGKTGRQAKKLVKKTAAKTKVKTKKKTTKEIKVKKPVRAKKEVKKPAVKKTVARKPEKEIKEKAKKVAPKKKTTRVIEKVTKKEPKKIAIPKKIIAKIPHKTIPTPVVPAKGLPAEYGEDRITLMVVDPWKLFAYWEVREDTLSRLKGMLTLKVYDVTGIDFDGKNANTTFDIPAYERVGDSYVGVGPNREFIVDIGVVLREGGFITIARSNKVTTPTIKVIREEGILPQEVYETVPAVGYF